MNREEFTIFINLLEKKYPVNDWKVNGVHLWPLIKIRLSFAFNAPGLSTGEKKSIPETLFFKTKKAVRGLFDFLSILIKGNRRVPTQLFCLAPHFRYHDGSRYVNRYYNQLFSKAKGSGKDILMAEYGNTTRAYRDNLDIPDKTVYFENLKYLALFLREFTWKKYSDSTIWPEFDLFLKEVNHHLKGKKLSRNEIIRQFIYIKILSRLYRKILKNRNISEVYILCYYVSEMYAMNLATSELGITSWDIQHGGQGNLHVAYSNFNSIPDSGYKLLPQKFWTWDLASAREIKKWSVNQNYHQVEVLGNPWIEYCIQRYTDEIDSSRKIILYTMQPIGELLIDEYIIETIARTPLDYVWWLRLHPRQIKEIDKLKVLLIERGLLYRVNIYDACLLPLPGILSKTHLHLSKYSGSILEAYTMKVKTIILDSIGVESFPDIANNDYGLILLEKDSELLLNKIVNSIEIK